MIYLLTTEEIKYRNMAFPEELRASKVNITSEDLLRLEIDPSIEKLY
jgi:hypothetical protein